MTVALDRHMRRSRLAAALVTALVVLPACGGGGGGDPAPAISSPPVLAAIAPASGVVAGSEPVTLTGSRFRAGAEVRIGGAMASAVSVATSGTSITAITPPGTAGPADVAVTNPDGGTDSLPGAFSYVTPPGISGIAPATASTAGGTPVTLSGTGFLSGATVAVGGASAPVFIVTPTYVGLTAPAGTPGSASVLLTNPDGRTASGTLAYADPPSIASVAPASGPTAGGTAVTVTGSGFASGATATIGGAAATIVTLSASTLVCTAPASGPGACALVVTNPDGLWASAGYTYLAPPPAVTGVTPSVGPLAGAQPVTVTGTGFQAGAGLDFAGVAATVVWLTPTQISARTPAGAGPGAVAVTVTNPDGQGGTLAAGFAYLAPAPMVLRVTPAGGPASGGGTVTVTGSGFAPGCTVAMGYATATVQSQTATTLVVTAPANTAGWQAPVAVTNPDGQSGPGTFVGPTYYFAPAPAVATSALLPAFVGRPVAQQCDATGGVEPFAWSATGLPAGLTLAAGGFLSGTPVATGSASVTLTATDSAGTAASATLALVVNAAPALTVSGRITYDDVPATSTGLALGSISTLAVRNACVWLEDLASPGVACAAGTTDGSGRYTLASPSNASVRVHVVARTASATGAFHVVDVSSASFPLPDFDVRSATISVGSMSLTGQDWNVPDSTRINGAFNILDVMQTLAAVVLAAAPGTDFGRLRCEWAPGSQQGAYYWAETPWSAARITLPGDRSTDSDEFDDSVVAHEFGHHLNWRFGGVDSIAGPHSPGDYLDPRVALDEGLATAWGQHGLGSPFYIATYGWAGGLAWVQDLENNAQIPAITDGYWSECSVQSIAWDLLDATPTESGDAIALSFGSLWTVCAQDLPGHDFAYLVDFVDSLVARNPTQGSAIAAIVGIEGIGYTPGGAPSVATPWPYTLASGGARTSTRCSTGVTAAWPQAYNRTSATDMFVLTATGPGPAAVHLTVTGTGPDAAASHTLDVYITDRSGRVFGQASLAPTGAVGETHSVGFALPGAGRWGVFVTSARPLYGGSWASGTYTVRAAY